MAEHEDLYQILQVHQSAQPEVIQAAYRRLAQLYHPDVNPSPDATKRMSEINSAYEVLSDPAKRRAYDRRRSARKEASSTYRSTRSNTESPEQANCFSMGSTKLRVLEIQGPPEEVSIERWLNEETWHYAQYDEVTFDMATSRVHGWDNSSTTLKVNLVAGSATAPRPYVELGDHKDQVIRLHGTPTRISVDQRFDLETWEFDAGTVDFSHSVGTVQDWYSFFGELKVRDDEDDEDEEHIPNYSEQRRGYSRSFARATVGEPKTKRGIAETIGGAIGTALALLMALWILGSLAIAIIAIVWSIFVR